MCFQGYYLQLIYTSKCTCTFAQYSLDELEVMTLCLQQFRFVFNNMEELLSEDQASVYGALSDHDRYLHDFINIGVNLTQATCFPS